MLNISPWAEKERRLIDGVRALLVEFEQLSLESLPAIAAPRQLYNELVELRDILTTQFSNLVAEHNMLSVLMGENSSTIIQRIDTNQETLCKRLQEYEDNITNYVTEIDSFSRNELNTYRDRLDTIYNTSKDVASKIDHQDNSLSNLMQLIQDQSTIILSNLTSLLEFTQKQEVDICEYLKTIVDRLEGISNHFDKVDNSFLVMDGNRNLSAEKTYTHISTLDYRLNEHQAEYIRALSDVRLTMREAEGGPASAIDGRLPAPLERVHGMIELNSQLARPRAEFPQIGDPDPFEEGHWEKVGGSGLGWSTGYRVRGFASLGNDLFTTVLAPDAPTDTGVWRLREDQWTHIVGAREAAPFVNGEANALLTFKDQILAAASGENGGLWRVAGGNVERLGGQAVAGAYCLETHDGCVYLGGDPAEVWVWDGQSMERVAGGGENGSWNSGELDGSVYCMASVGSELYVGLAQRSYGPSCATVWCLSGGRWRLVGGEGVRGSWTHPHIAYVLDLVPHSGSLVACLTRPRTLPVAASSAWAYENGFWRPVTPQTIPWPMHLGHIWNHAVSWRGRLVIAVGDLQSDPLGSRPVTAKVWALDPGEGAEWRCVGGGDQNPAWAASPLADTRKNTVAGRRGGLWIYRMHVHNEQLYCGFAGHSAAAEVWRWIPREEPAGNKASAARPTATGSTNRAPKRPRRSSAKND